MKRALLGLIAAVAALCGWGEALAQTSPLYATATPSTLARAPLNTDDAAHGYVAGQLVVDTAHNITWTAASVTTGQAVWVPSQRRPYKIVGNRNMIPQALSTAVTTQVISSLTYRTGATQVCNIRLRYVDWYISGTNVETANGSDLTVKVSLTYNGTLYPITVVNVRSFTVPAASAYVETDPLGICIPANTQFSIATLANGGAGNSYPYGIEASTALGDKYENGTTVTDNVDTPGSIGTSGFRVTYGPALVLGDSVGWTQNVVIIADSRGWGGTSTASAGDVSTAAGGDANGCFGYIQRNLCSNQIGWIYIGRPSVTAAQWAAQGADARRLTLVRDVGTVLLNELGTNDLAAGASNTTVATNLGTVNTRWASFQFKVVQDTIQPRPSTTDACATLVNQSLPAMEAQRLLLNAAIRAGTITGQHAYREASTPFEVNSGGTLTQDGGYYQVSPSLTSNDCIHLNAVGAANGSAVTIYPLR